MDKKPTDGKRNHLDIDALPDNWRGNSDTARCTDDEPICWVCLEGPTAVKPLVQPCSCPRVCHAQCIARWQLQSAGSRRETHCDFCKSRLPDWKNVLSRPGASQAPAIMNVNFDGRTYSFEVKPGPDGYKQFTLAIRRAFNLPGESELNITFTCDEPCTGRQGDMLTLQGAGAYDAAVHCAAVSAARRAPLLGNSGPPDVSATSPSADRVDETMPGYKGRRLVYFGKRLRSTICEWLAIK